MLTKTFHKVIRSAITGENFDLKDAGGSTNNINVTEKVSNGVQDYYTRYMMRIPDLMNKDLYTTNLRGDSYGGVCFGTGTAAPTENDYTITQKLLNSATASVTRNVVQDGSTYTGTYTIINNGTQPITITEVGLFGYCLWYTGLGNGYCYLIDRTLLDEPLTIPTGGIGRVVYTVTFA